MHDVRGSSADRALRRLMDVRPGEGRTTTFGALTLFLFMMGHGALETARDALFLTRLPAARLAWVYLAIAATSLVATSIGRRLGASGSERLTPTLAVAAIVTALLWFVAHPGGIAAAYIVYVWAGVAATVATVQLWQLLGDRFSVDQAKRLFALIGGGAVLGIAAGSAFASVLAERVSPASLLLVGAASFAAATLASLGFGRAPLRARGAKPEPILSVRGLLRDHPFARRLMLLALVASVTLTVADYLFKSAVAANVPAARLGVFFGRFYAAVNVVALVVQVGVTGWVLRAVGVTRALAVLPAVALAGATTFIAWPVLAAVLLVKSADGLLRHSLQRTSFELLFLPLSSAARRTAKDLIDVLGQRGGQALAAGIILAFVAVDADARLLAASVAALALAWMVGLIGVRGRYLELFRARLRAGDIDLSLPLPPLDLASVELLVASLSSASDAEAIAALEILERAGKTRLVPPLLAYHPSREVALRALALFGRSGRREVVPLLGRLLDSEDAERRVAAIRVLDALGHEAGTLARHAEDDSAAVRATALVGLAAKRTDSALFERIAAIVEHGPREAQLALARAIAVDPAPLWVGTLLDLGCKRDVALRLEVARAAQALPDPALVPILSDMLVSRDTRPAAREALFAVGAPVLPYLREALASPDTPLPVRRHIPRTLARFVRDEDALLLLERLELEPDGMTRFKILRALGQMQIDRPALRLDRALLRRHVHATIERLCQLLRWLVALDAAPREQELLAALLVEKRRFAMERLFRLLGLLHPRAGLELVYRGLRREDPKARAASRELLDEALARDDMREVVRVLADELPEAERLQRLPAHLRRGALDHRAALLEMTDDGSEAVRIVATYCRCNEGKVADVAE